MNKLDFSEPAETLKTLTSETISYRDLLEKAEKLMPQLSAMHVNQDGRQFQTITQCILDCIKRIYGFKSTRWVSENKLRFELNKDQKPINFTRINSKQEVCQYKIVNFDQIDFSKELVFADEYEVIKKLIEQAKQVNITMCIDDLDISTNPDTDIFYSNKQTLKNAQLWIDMLNVRNSTSHEYNMDKVNKYLLEMRTNFFKELEHLQIWLNKIDKK